MNNRIWIGPSIFAAAIVMALTLAGSTAALAQRSQQRPVRTVLQTLDVAGTNREASLVIVEFAPGAAEVPHTHPGEYIAYVLDGAFEFEVVDKAKAIYRAGDSFIVESGRAHLGRNVAQGPTKLLITFVLEKGKPPSAPVK